MIGQNDSKGEIFTLADAKALNSFAVSQGVGRMSMWSLNRDVSCGSNYVNLGVVSDSCSGVKQGGASFATMLAKHFVGSTDFASKKVTKSQVVSATVPQGQPEDQPVPDLVEHGVLPRGHQGRLAPQRVRREVVDAGRPSRQPGAQRVPDAVDPDRAGAEGRETDQAADRCRGNLPDLVGTAIYNRATASCSMAPRTQAKWWTQGNSPAAASSDPDGSPWVPLTVAQINAINEAAATARRDYQD